MDLSVEYIKTFDKGYKLWDDRVRSSLKTTSTVECFQSAVVSVR